MPRWVTKMMIDSRRRSFLRMAGVAAGLLTLAPTSLATIQPATLFHEQMQQYGINSRELWLIRGREEFRAPYAQNGILIRDGYLGACHILRDVEAGKSHIIDPAILEILAAINAWMTINKEFRPINVNSAYRSLATNRRAGGASRSLHMEGRAVDIRIPGISAIALSHIAREVSVGGIGIYARRDFLHLDTGDNRGWGDV